MNQEDYKRFSELFFEKCREISANKASDYGQEEDVFSNFNSVGVYNVLPEHGFLTRMSDKLSRIANYINKGYLKVNDESVADTLLDLANYCCLLTAYLDNERNFHHEEWIADMA